jgi:hypothetical protein
MADDGLFVPISGDPRELLNALKASLKGMDGFNEAIAEIENQFTKAEKAANESLKKIADSAQKYANQINETQFKANPYQAKAAAGAELPVLDSRKLIDFGSGKDITKEIAPVVSEYGKQLAKLKEEAAKAGKEAREAFVKEFGSASAEVGKSLEAGFGFVYKSIAAGAAAVTTAVGAFTATALNVGGDFEKQMNRVAIISGASAEELGLLTDKAREMGKTLPIMAKDAAEAMEIMAQRGTAVKDILTSVADVTNLAISQNISLADSADLLGSTITNFGFAMEDASKITDMFNNASNQSALSVSSLIEGLKYIAPAAAAANQTLDGTLAAMEVLANSGLKGSMIGTGLSGVITKLSQSSKVLGVATKDLNGNMRPLADIFSELHDRGITLAEATKTFGAYSSKAALNLAKYGDT